MEPTPVVGDDKQRFHHHEHGNDHKPRNNNGYFFNIDDTANNKTLLGGDFTDLDKIESSSNQIVEEEAADEETNTDETRSKIKAHINKDMAIEIGDCTIYDNKESEAAAVLGGDECEAPSTTVDASQSRAATTTAAAISTNKNSKPIVVASTANEAVKHQPVQEEVVNFDHLVNKEAHFDRRMLKLIEGKLQATRSATSFSK